MLPNTLAMFIIFIRAEHCELHINDHIYSSPEFYGVPLLYWFYLKKEEPHIERS